MKKITKKESKEFNDKVTEIILSAGFVYDTESHDYKKETQFGIVSIRVPEQVGSEIYTVFCRFEDVQKALKIFNCNRFTGKYNFHDFYGQNTFGMVEFFLDQLNSYSAEE